MIYGNLAYKYDYIEDKTDREQRKKQPKPNAGGIKRKREQKELSYAAKIMLVLVTAVSAVFMIIQYVTANDTRSTLKETAQQYEFEKSVTAQKSFELEQSIDLAKIESEAVTRLGMKRPEKHQIVYLDVKKSDVTVKTADEVEGFSNRIKEFIESIKSNMIEFFSI